MFKGIRFLWKLRVALVELRCDPAIFKRELRRAAVDYSLMEGLSPEDAAVGLVMSLPIGMQPNDWELMARAWAAQGKLSRPPLENFGLHHLLGVAPPLA